MPLLGIVFEFYSTCQLAQLFVLFSRYDGRFSNSVADPGPGALLTRDPGWVKIQIRDCSSHPLSWPCVSDLLTSTSKARADYAP